MEVDELGGHGNRAILNERSGEGNDRKPQGLACAARAGLLVKPPPGPPGVLWSRTMKASPLTLVKERFGSKDKLVDAVRDLATDELWIDRVDEDKGLERVSNKKLLHLHAVLSEVKSQFGSRAKLIDAICELEKRSKDEGYRDRLGRWSTPRLFDWYKSAKKRAA